MIVSIYKTKQGWVVMAPENGWVPCNCKKHEHETGPAMRAFSETSKTKKDAIAYAKYLGAEEINFA